jgi:hypothetical protein
VRWDALAGNQVASADGLMHGGFDRKRAIATTASIPANIAHSCANFDLPLTVL